MKMLLTLLIALLCAFSLSACGSNAADTPNKDTQQNAGNAVGGAMDDVGDAAKNAGKAVSDAVKPK